MSINVTVNGNHLNIRRGRMVLSDLDQIKKNERDRRRRLRLEQVRQQSKEISDRLLKRAKNIAKEELKKLENSDKLNLKQIHNEKILEVQQKYQEDMADIGEAHVSAILEPDHNVIIKEKDRQNKLTALKRGKEAIKQIKSVQQETAQQQHEERLRQVREVEDLRSTMVAKLSQKTVPEMDTICNAAGEETDQEVKQHKSAKKKSKKVISKKSPGKITKSYLKVVGSDLKTRSPLVKSRTKVSEGKNDSCVVEQQPETSSDTTPPIRQTESEHNAGEVPNVSIKNNKTTRYNPEDYVQTASNSTASDGISSFSDDSSYFSDNNNEHCSKIRTSKYVKCPATEKVQLYDHNKRQSNTYDKPVGVVEKIHTWNEPSAIDLAQEIQQAESVETHLSESRRYNAQKRGEDAALREKVRRDYRTLIQNLSQLASEERKLKASRVERYPKSTHMLERRKIIRDQHKRRLNHALKTLLNEECPEHCVSYPVERQITLAPRESDNKSTDIRVSWEDPCCSKHTDTDRISPTKDKENEESREEQILDMLKKVERQKRLLLQEFGADLPNDIFSASMKPLFEKEKAVQTVRQDTDVPKPSSPEIRVINVLPDESSEKNEIKEKIDSPIKKVEIAVQTTTGDKRSIVQDKGTQVKLTQEEAVQIDSGDNEIQTAAKHYPLEPKITVITPETDNESSSSVTPNAVIDTDKQSSKPTPKRTKRSAKTLRRVPSKKFQKSRSTRASKTSSATKEPKSTDASPKKANTEEVSGKRIDMYVDERGLNIKVQPTEVREVAVNISTQSSQVYSPSVQEQATSKSRWIRSKSRLQIKDISDTSTSFASPPPIKPRDVLEVLSNNMSILEMLDSSINESMKLLRRDVSPVSTPETPSPRTMRLPSNIPRPDKIAKLLKSSSTSFYTSNSNSLSSVKNSCSTSTDLSDHQQHERPSTNHKTKLSKHPVPLEFCLCNNPNCNQIHAKFDEIRSYALKNCPQILQKYEDLQTTCAERIISLTNLIEKVRNEQKGMEFSIINTGDETSLMQLPSPKLATNDLQSVRKLVENIEAIHNQLAKTLIESQRIIKNKAAVKEEGNQTKEMGVETVKNEDTPRKLSPSVGSKDVVKTKGKPKIIRDEKVNVQLNGFKLQREAQTSMSPSKHEPRLTSKHNEEEMIEKLSKEILEQSKSFNNNVLAAKEVGTSKIKRPIETATDVTDSKSATTNKKDDRMTQKYSIKEQKKNKDFVPILIDIPKIPKTVDTVVCTNGRSKPPVSLLSGPYRTEIESSGHELSTIIEFDTPDTINKSQNTVRSPKSVKKSVETQVSKCVDAVKPPEAVLLFNLRNQRLEEPCVSSVKKLSPVVDTRNTKESEISSDSPRTCKSVANSNLAASNDEKRERIIQESSDKKLRYNMGNQESLQMEESTGTERQNKQYIDKDKITSTSSNSFSELSGISQIASTPSSSILKYASSPEEMETALKKLGLGWAITTLKKTREASALSSSSNSDVTPINTVKRISPVKKQFDNNYGLPDISDVSSISIKEASKSTEQAVLLKGRTSTPKLQHSNSNSVGDNSSNTNVSENDQEPNNDLIIPNISLTKTKSTIKTLENL